ncbi:MBL fold metallo-hydrolase [bacterium]|nr:MBL fold metallo-hydrolase [bacterium]
MCTHGHFDHVLGIAESEECDIPVYVNEKDKIHYENLLNTLTTWGFPSKKCDFRPTHFIDENTALSIGEYSIKIFETPGHSKGSVSYYVDGNLFCGDALFCESIGRTDFIDGDYDELITSIKSKLLTLPTDTKVYPGHGPSTTIQNEKLNNLFLV